MSTFLHPGHFVDIEIPVFRGQPLLVARNDVEYEFYLNWLADHLYQDKPTEQDETPATLKNREFQARCLGDSVFYHLLYCIEPYEWYMSNGTDYNTAFKDMESQHAELYKNEISKYPDDIDSLDTWINPEIWENALREYQEQKDIKAIHADLGYRGELSQMLDGINKHEARYSILNNFYRSFNEEASK